MRGKEQQVMDALEKCNNFYREKLSVQEVTSCLREYVEGGAKFVIYGCGPLGNYLMDVLADLSLPFFGFVDDFYGEREYKGVGVFTLEEIAEQSGKVCMVLTPHRESNKKIMREKIAAALGSGCHIMDKNALLYVSHGISLDPGKKQFGNIYEKIDLIVTNCCTLKCRDCSELIPYVKPEHFELEDVERDIGKMNDLVDYIAVLEVMGGEPLLYPGLAEVLHYIAGLPNIYQIMLDTNGTVVPDEETLEAIREHQVLVHITDYGEISTKKLELLRKCEERGIYCTMRKIGNWADHDAIKDYGRDGMDEKFRTCCSAVECSNIYRGRWHVCPVDTKVSEMGLFTPSDKEYIELHGGETEEIQREKLYALSHRKKAVSSCRYCKGTSETIPGGIQVDAP